MNEAKFVDVIELRKITDVRYDIQDCRTRTENRLRNMPQETYRLYSGQLRTMEKDLTDRIAGLLNVHPIWIEWLSKVRGIGPNLAGSLISQIEVKFTSMLAADYERYILYYHFDEMQAAANLLKKPKILTRPPKSEIIYSQEQIDLAFKSGTEKTEEDTENTIYMVPVRRGIEAFDTPSKLWAYFGLDVDKDNLAPKRVKGQKYLGYSPKLRVLAWKIATQFVKTGGGYYEMLYRKEKMRLIATRIESLCPYFCVVENDEGKEVKRCRHVKPGDKLKAANCKGHIDMMAKRAAVKRFLLHLWLRWRELEGLPTRKPYVQEKLGHTTIDSPLDAVEKPEKPAPKKRGRKPIPQ